MGRFTNHQTNSTMFKALVSFALIVAVVSCNRPVFTLVDDVFQSRTHYGNPMPMGCLSDEIAARIQGANGDACFPRASTHGCPTDLPTGTTASPMPVIQDQTGARYCGLICSGIATGNCPQGASCQSPGSLGRMLNLQATVGL